MKRLFLAICCTALALVANAQAAKSVLDKAASEFKKCPSVNVTFEVAIGEDIDNGTITLQGNAESTSTKDTEGFYSQDTIVSKQWSAQVDTYQSETSALKNIITLFNAAAPVAVGWDQTAGAQNRVVQNANFKRSGQALLNDFTMTFNDRETVSVSLQFQGTGTLS